MPSKLCAIFFMFDIINKRQFYLQVDFIYINKIYRIYKNQLTYTHICHTMHTTQKVKNSFTII